MLVERKRNHFNVLLFVVKCDERVVVKSDNAFDQVQRAFFDCAYSLVTAGVYGITSTL
jgi:hypothetical protein